MNRFIYFLPIAFLIACAHRPRNDIDRTKETVILMHGFGRSASAMKKYEDYFQNEGYQVFNIGYSSIGKEIESIKAEVFYKLDKVKDLQIQKLHFVGHSLGGLLIRSYLSERKIQNLGRVVIIASPNKGTPLVEALKDKWYFSLAGAAVNSLSSNGSEFLSGLKPPDYELGVIAGVVNGRFNESIPGDDDGMVSLESAQLNGSKDLVILPLNHGQLRESPIAIRQTHKFIQSSQFEK